MSTIPQFTSVFEGLRASSFPFRYEGELGLQNVLGGTPSDQRVIDGWMRTKIGLDKDEDIKRQVQAVMAARDVSMEEAAADVAKNRSLNGFLRARCPKCPTDITEPLCEDGQHQLMLSGRQLKACLKEAASVAVAADKIARRGWGTTNKGLLGFFAEHLFIVEDELFLNDVDGNPVYEPTGTLQHFVHTRFGSAIQYQEFVRGARFEFTTISDFDFSAKDWGMIWTTAELEGLGASRSQGYGRFSVIKWKDTTLPAVRAKAKERAASAATKAVKAKADD
jgi:hypothetical protein